MHESESGGSVFHEELQDYKRECYTLFDMFFSSLESTRTSLFKRYLQAYATARVKRREQANDPSIDTKSLTCCVLYSLIGNADYSELWQTFLEHCSSDELIQPTNDGPPYLHLAIRLGYEWSPVLSDIVDANTNALESRDAEHNFPPFVLAAASAKSNPRLLGWDLPTQYPDEAAATNTIFELLRKHPIIHNNVEPEGKTKHRKRKHQA